MPSWTNRKRWTGICAVLWTIAPPLNGQIQADSASAGFRLSTPVVAAAGPTLAIAFMPLDSHIRDAFQDTGFQDSRAASNTADAFRQLGELAVPGVVGAAALTAWALDEPDVRDASLHVLESIIGTAGVVFGMKAVAGRARPFAAPEAWDYGLGRGLNEYDYRSFPSGHTSQAFALAASVGGELTEHTNWSPAWLSATLYGAAGLTALSRIYDDRHWASDTLMGAAVGVLTARVVRAIHHD